MKQILIFPTGTLKAADKARIAKAGILAIEADDPSKIVSVIPGVPLASADDMLMAAMSGVSVSGIAQPRFFEELYRRMKEREAKSPSA